MRKTIKHLLNKKKYKKLICHPKNKTSNNGSCLDLKTLLLLRRVWNKRHPDCIIKYRTKHQLWGDIQHHMSDNCNHEMCWIEKSIDNENLKKRIKNKFFVPNMPNSWKKNKTEWLSSVELSNVLKQYETKYPHFKFIGPSPIDFDDLDVTYNANENICVWPELCNFSLKQHILNGNTQIGMIFNLDKHYQPGSHWVSLFLDIDKKKMFYFDSAGSRIPKELSTFIRKITREADALNIKLSVDNNVNFQHQSQNTECGMYCLYFIITLLMKKNDFETFKTKRIKDNLVQKFRTIYFNNV